MIEHVIEATQEAFENDENAIQDHFAEEKELEIQRSREELEKLSKVFIPPDKEKFESKKRRNKVVKRSRRSKDYSNCLKLGKICRKKIAQMRRPPYTDIS